MRRYLEVTRRAAATVPIGTSLVAELVVGSLCILVGISCVGNGASGTGRVSGIVAAAPAGPLDNRNIPIPDQQIEFTSKSSSVTSISTSQSDGSYAISLTAGMYEVRLVGFAPLQLYYGRDLNHYDRWPLITVTSGQDTKLDLVYDSKIR